MKVKIKTHYDQKGRIMEQGYEKGGGESLTVPNDSLTIPQLIKRNRSGRQPEVGKEPVYHGGIYMPDIKKMDISEYYDMLDENQKVITEYYREKEAKEKKQKEDEIGKWKQSYLEFEEYKKKFPQENKKGGINEE